APIGRQLVGDGTKGIPPLTGRRQTQAGLADLLVPSLDKLAQRQPNRTVVAEGEAIARLHRPDTMAGGAAALGVRGDLTQ
ncbi:MAG: hypothetical protein BDTLLHRC_000861, partial [Candidatus Fervidibacter sp.]